MDRTFNNVLKEKRKYLGLSREKYSKLCGINSNTLREFEAGRSFPTGTTLKKLVKPLKVEDVDEVVDLYCDRLLSLDKEENVCDLVKILDCTSAYLFVNNSGLWRYFFKGYYNKLKLIVKNTPSIRLKNALNIDYRMYLKSKLSDDDIKSIAKTCADYCRYESMCDQYMVRQRSGKKDN